MAYYFAELSLVHRHFPSRAVKEPDDRKLSLAVATVAI